MNQENHLMIKTEQKRDDVRETNQQTNKQKTLKEKRCIGSNKSLEKRNNRRI